MPELRRDLVRDNWVVIVTNQALKAADFPINRNCVTADFDSDNCPFCEGHESHTTEEIAAVRLQGTLPDTPGWLVRSVPNKFAAFRLEGDLNLHTHGIQQCYNGLGHHEVIVETPWHNEEIHHRSQEHIELFFQLLRDRYIELASDHRIKYIQIYKNRGLFAGASQQHSHSQILAYPIVPNGNRGIPQFYRETGHCLLCETIKEEKALGERVVMETDAFLVICPYASRFSYESWIIPKVHQGHFGDIGDEEIRQLSSTLRQHVAAMMNALDQPSYNFVINSAPVNSPGEEGYHWYMEIMPRLLVVNAVEIASGFYMNPVAPEESVRILQESMAAKS